MSLSTRPASSAAEPPHFRSFSLDEAERSGWVGMLPGRRRRNYLGPAENDIEVFVAFGTNGRKTTNVCYHLSAGQGVFSGGRERS